MKNSISLITSLFLCIQSIAFAAPKIATINSAKILGSLESFKKDTEIHQKSREDLLKDQRKIALDEMAKKVQALSEKAQKHDKNSEDFKLIAEEGKAAMNAYRGLAEEWQRFQQERLRAITEEFISLTTKRNDEIMAVASKIANAEGFVWVVETNGRSSTKMPVVLYVKESTDITDKVITELNKEQEPE